MPRLSNEIIDDLLPERTPPFLVPPGMQEGQILDLIGSAQTEREQHIAIWLTFFQSAIETDWPGSQYGGFQYATYGFIPVSETGQRFFGSRHPFVFGASIEIEESFNLPTQEYATGAAEGVELSIVINRRSAELHSSTVTGLKGPGTVACWAKSNKTNIAPSEGILTANHVVEAEKIGQSVSCTLPGVWHLADRGGCKIDAALVVNNQQGIPATCAPLNVERLPIAGTDVEFTGAQSSQPISAKVTHSFVHPSLLTTRHPMRIFLDDYGLGGDSGALVEMASNGNGAGIYMGRNPIDGGHDYEGVAQALAQAVHQLMLSVYG
ncbi:MAG: hypothetical protein ACK5NN_12120 [Sphingomonadaceae bacterium]